jgi:hypothetical protein
MLLFVFGMMEHWIQPYRIGLELRVLYKAEPRRGIVLEWFGKDIREGKRTLWGICLLVTLRERMI